MHLVQNMTRSSKFLVILILICSVLVVGWCVSGIVSSLRQTCPASNENCFENRTEYTAAVVEYKPIPIGDQSPQEALLSNVNAYINLMEEASQHEVDIIVFPEYGLTTVSLPQQREQARKYFVDVPEIGVTPCDKIFSNHTRILYELSCAAKNYRMYTVLNLGEVEECGDGDSGGNNETDEKCPTDGAYHYNTNIVFDRRGTIIARYRKFHLYFEPQFDYPPLEYSSFKTDFGAEFGLFTCFDIIFAHPAVEMVASKSIKNFAFPTAWVDELPFLTAIQTQSMWAQSNKANLLASGYHQPDRGSMGSGIYSGHNGVALDYVYDRNSGTKLVINSVPIFPEMKINSKKGEMKLPAKEIPNENIQETDHFWLREDLSNCSHKTIDLNLNHERVCNEDLFCCDLKYDIAFTPETLGSLKLIVFDGKRTVAAKRDWFEWQVCALVHCLNDTLESCTEALANESFQRSNHPRIEKLSIEIQPLKDEYEAEGVAEPALSLLDTSFNLISQKYFEIRKWIDEENGKIYAQASTKNNVNFGDVQVKTIALIQKIYSGRI